jgi:putative nucleotidyltransferase with HDIG domain
MRYGRGEKSLNSARIFIVPAVMVFFICLALYSGIFESLEMITLDLRLRATSAGEPAPIAFTSIDQNSLKALGQWPLPRALYVNALDNILSDGARAVLVDIDLSSRGPDPDQDRQLIEHISKAGKVVLTVQMEENKLPEGAIIRNVSLPLPELVEGALALGAITFEIDRDGLIRRMPDPIDFIDTIYPPLGLVGAELIRTGSGKDVPRDALITFSERNLASYPSVSFNNVLTGKFRPGTFTDRIVLMGATSPDLHDFWPTPIGVIPGMFIQASVLETGLNRSWSMRQGFGSAALSILLVSLIMGRLMDRADWMRGALYLLGYLFMLISASAVLSNFHFMIHFTPLFILGLIQYPVQIALNLRKVEESLDLERRKTDTILKFSEMRDVEEAGKKAYLVPLVLLRQVLGLKKIILYIQDDEDETGWRAESVTGDENGHAKFSKMILDEAVESGQMVFDRDTTSGTISVYVPMMTTRKAVGVLCTEASTDFTDDEDNVRLLLSYATQASYYIEASQLDSQVKVLYSNTIRAISKALDTKDYYTSAHSELSLEYVEKFGDACGLSRLEIEALHIGTLLHDIGKIGVPDLILSKQGRLTPEEYDSMKGHPVMGYEIIRDLPFPEDVKMIVKHHHEHYDGRGYPDGLKGDEIPKLVRIFSILDTYEALTGNRPYKESHNADSARSILLQSAGEQFDPHLVELFTSIF